MKSCPMKAELYHVDGRTDWQTEGQADRHEESNSCFSQFCERTDQIKTKRQL